MIETATFDAKTNYVELLAVKNVDVSQNRSPSNSRSSLQRFSNSSIRNHPKSRKLRMDVELDMRICSAPISHRDSVDLTSPENGGQLVDPPKSFYVFRVDQFPRNLCIRLMKNCWFERLSILVIVVNCITLGMYRPCEDNKNCKTFRCAFLSAIDTAIFVYFTVEMVIRMISTGVMGPKGYWSESWNRLDFMIVFSGFAEFILSEYLGDINFTAIRTVRVLRPLRAINRIPSLRILVSLLLDTLPMLSNVLLLCFFLFFTFGIVGVQMWAGMLRNRCFVHTQNISDVPSWLSKYYSPGDNIMENYICSLDKDGGMHRCNDLPNYWVSNKKCNSSVDDVLSTDQCVNWNQYYTECKSEAKNPFSGSISFDNIGSAWMTIFLVISMEGWTDIMYLIQDAHSFWSWTYFVLLIVVGSFFMINLCLVVITTQFSETKRRETERMMMEKALNLYEGHHIDAGEIPEQTAVEADDVGIYGAIVTIISQAMAKCEEQIKVWLNRYIYKQKPEEERHSSLSQIQPIVRCDIPVITITLYPGTDNPRCGKFYDRSYETDPLTVTPTVTVLSHNGGPYQENRSFNRAKKEKAKPNRLKNWRTKVAKIVEHPKFSYAIMLAILLNTMSMGSEYHEQPDWLTQTLDIANYIFTGLFALEMAMKLFAHGICAYISDGFNLFDGTVVLISIIELAYEGSSGLSVLRTFRLLRVFKLVRSMPALRQQMVTMLRTVDNVTVFFGLLGLFIFVFSILGMNLFGCKFCRTASKERQELAAAVHMSCERKNFDSLLWASITVFQIVTQEDWNIVLFNAIANTTPWAAIYFVCLMTIGNYILLNLLVAILVQGCLETRDEEERRIATSGDNNLTQTPADANWLAVDCSREIAGSMPNIQREGSLEIPKPANLRKSNSLDYQTATTFEKEEINSISAEVDRSCSDRILNIWLRRFGCFASRKEYSLYLFPSGNRLRKICVQIAASKPFDYLILFCIFVTCGTLALERPSIEADSVERMLLNVANFAVTGIFTLEMIFKIVGSGFYWCEDSYLKNGWNALDGILAVASVSYIVIDLATVDHKKFLGLLRVLRSLKPLRMINRSQGVRLVVETLITSLKPMGNIALICCTYFFIFGILGIQLFKGTMYYCEGLDVTNVTNKTGCLAVDGNRWVVHRYNFDNLGQALMSLFVLASKDGWISLMYQGIDAVGVDMQPIENHNSWAILYFISFLVLVGFFVLSLFVGVVVENFHQCRKDMELVDQSAPECDKLRRQWVQKCKKRRILQRQGTKKKLSYKESYSRWRILMHNAVINQYFDLAIAFIIGLNIVTMSMEFYMMPEELSYILKLFNTFFTAVFVLEAIMKLIALGPKLFFADTWNRFDLFIALFSVAGIVIEEVKAGFLPINPTIIRVMRVMRISRTLKLLKMAKGIRPLLDTIRTALPQVSNLGCLFVLLFLIFAALGVELFGHLECSEEYPCAAMSEHANFRNFGIAMLTLFRVVTGDNWNGIMKDILREKCDHSDHCTKNCCVSQVIAPMYFVIFVLTVQFVLVNIVVAVLMKHLEDNNAALLTYDLDDKIVFDESSKAENSDVSGDHQSPGHLRLTPTIVVGE